MRGRCNNRYLTALFDWNDEVERRQITGADQQRVGFRSALPDGYAELKKVVLRDAFYDRGALFESFDSQAFYRYDFETGFLEETLQVKTDLFRIDGRHSYPL